MDLENRISLLIELGEYMQSDNEEWRSVKTAAFQQNAWFIPEFIDLAVSGIVRQFLQPDLLRAWVKEYDFPSVTAGPKNIGLVTAGNIPLVGFHDFLCCFISGHRQDIKLSGKDTALFTGIFRFLHGKNAETKDLVQTATLLKGMDAYIATGSNNSARYFDYYFSKYPSLIRRNRTSIAILNGEESPEQLTGLADDVFQFFGLGCRNVTQIHVPENYDFVPLLNAFKKYSWMADNNKYKNNFDYRLSLAILNKVYYMSNDCLLFIENESPFSPIAVLHYQYYADPADWIPPAEDTLQCIVGKDYLPFGSTQLPGLNDYADGCDTMQFLRAL